MFIMRAILTLTLVAAVFGMARILARTGETAARNGSYRGHSGHQLRPARCRPRQRLFQRRKSQRYLDERQPGRDRSRGGIRRQRRNRRRLDFRADGGARQRARHRVHRRQRPNPQQSSRQFRHRRAQHDSINSAKDLVGKKVSAGLINSANYAHMREWLQRNSVDPDAVQFLRSRSRRWRMRCFRTARRRMERRAVPDLYGQER